MSTYLRKCIDIAPTAVISPDPFVANDYRNLRRQPWWPALRATTSHLRLWADWPSLQRVADEPPGFGPLAAASLAALDAQIEAAHADGLQIILLPYRYPRWANGTEGIPGRTVADFEYFTWDRFARYAQYVQFRAGTFPTLNWKAFEYRTALDGHGSDSRWGGFVAWLWERYADRLAAFEIVNEPNLQLWPQRSQVDTEDLATRWGTTNTSLVITPAVAEMMTTVNDIARTHGDDGPLLLAPSTSDSDTSDVPRSTTISHTNPYATSADPFVESLLSHLDQRGFEPDERWLWSFHNYADVERKQQHVVFLRRLLTERGWAGRQLDGGPELWCTEGGCRINAMITRFRPALGGRDATVAEQVDYQAQVLREALSRHHYAKGAGAGVGMLTQYTTYEDVNFKSGLLEAAASGGAARPALAVWSKTPEYFPAPVQRAAWRPQF
jgi:hypothetical protein